MVVVNHIVIGQGVGRGEDQAAGPVGVGAGIAHDATIRWGGRAVDHQPGGMVVVDSGVGNQRAMSCFTDIDAVIRVVGGAVIMHREPDKLIVRRAGHQDAMVLGVFDFHILQANETGGTVAGIGNLNTIVGDIAAITDQATDNGILTAGCGNRHTPPCPHRRLERDCANRGGFERKGGTPRRAPREIIVNCLHIGPSGHLHGMSRPRVRCCPQAVEGGINGSLRGAGVLCLGAGVAVAAGGGDIICGAVCQGWDQDKAQG